MDLRSRGSGTRRVSGGGPGGDAEDRQAETLPEVAGEMT